MNNWASILPLLLILGVMVPAVVTDLKSLRIPNWLSLVGFVAGITLHGLLGGWGGMGMAALAGIVLLLVTFPLFAIGWLGAGDVKLLAATGAIAGNIPLAFWILLLTMVSGGLVSLAILLKQLGLRQAVYLPVLLVTRGAIPLQDKAMYVPYSLAIATGSVVVLVTRAAVY